MRWDSDTLVVVEVKGQRHGVLYWHEDGTLMLLALEPPNDGSIYDRVPASMVDKIIEPAK